MFTQFLNPDALERFTEEVEGTLATNFSRIDKNIDTLQARVLAAFQKNKVSDHHLQVSTGYGYNDEGRDTLERVYADVFGAQAGLVRPQIGRAHV